MIYLYVILDVCLYARTILSGIRIGPRTLKVPPVLNAKWNLSIVHVCFHLFDLICWFYNLNVLKSEIKEINSKVIIPQSSYVSEPIDFKSANHQRGYDSTMMPPPPLIVGPPQGWAQRGPNSWRVHVPLRSLPTNHFKVDMSSGSVVCSNQTLGVDLRTYTKKTCVWKNWIDCFNHF